MKKKKKQLVMSLSVLLISFLLFSSSLNLSDTRAFGEKEHNKYTINSFDSTIWMWNTTEVVSTESTDASSWPSIAVDSAGNIHVAWYDDTDYAGSGIDMDIFYKHWDASTSAWTTTEVVSTESTGGSHTPSLATDSAGNIHIAWQDYTDYAGAGGDEDIFYKRWDHSSLTWTTTEVVSTESTLYADFSSLVVDSAGNIHVAWNDGANYAGSGIDMDIFYKHWDASTSSWTLTEVVSTESTEPSGSPSLVVDTVGNIHVVWKDLTDYTGAGTDGDIFYKIYAGSPTAPELAFINPNPTEINTINLDWNNISLATSYFVYRSDYYIWSVEDLLSIDEVTTSYYTDTLPSEGYYYYVIVARNLLRHAAAGVACHGDHAREAVLLLLKIIQGKAPDYKIKNEIKLRMIARKLGKKSAGPIMEVAKEVVKRFFNPKKMKVLYLTRQA